MIEKMISSLLQLSAMGHSSHEEYYMTSLFIISLPNKLESFFTRQYQYSRSGGTRYNSGRQCPIRLLVRAGARVGGHYSHERGNDEKSE